MSAKDEVEKLLKAHNAVLLRGKKHKVYQLDTGERFITPSTPSDSLAWDNNLTDLKRILGLTAKHKEGVRRIKKRTPKTQITPGWLTALPKKETELPPAFKSKWLGPPIPKPEPEDDKPIRNPLYVKEGFWQRKSTRTADKGFSYSPEVLRHANFLCRTEGDQAMHNYLNRVRTGAHMEENGTGKLGSIEQMLDSFQKERQLWIGKEAEAKREIIRCNIVIEQLAKTLDLITTPSANLKIRNAHKPMAGNSDRYRSWSSIFTEVLANGPMPRCNFIDALESKVPGSNRKSLDSMTYNWVKRGKLVNNEGMISLAQ